MRNNFKFYVCSGAAVAKVLKKTVKKYQKQFDSCNKYIDEGKIDMYRYMLSNSVKDLNNNGTTIRHFNVLYGFLRGKDYSQIENKVHLNNLPSFRRIWEVMDQVEVFDEDIQVTKQHLSEWIDNAIAHINNQHDGVYTDDFDNDKVSMKNAKA